MSEVVNASYMGGGKSCNFKNLQFIRLKPSSESERCCTGPWRLDGRNFSERVMHEIVEVLGSL